MQSETKILILELQRSQKEFIQLAEEHQALQQKSHAEDINEWKTLVENQRTDFMVKLAELKTAKEKLEKVNTKLETDLQHQIIRYKELEEYKRGIEADLSVVCERLQETEKQLIKLKAESDHKDNKINYFKELLDGLIKRTKIEDDTVTQ